MTSPLASSQHDDLQKLRESMFLAQAYAVSELHYFLPMYPIAWIMFMHRRFASKQQRVFTKPGGGGRELIFEKVYVRKKSSHMTINFLFVLLLMATCGTFIYAWTLMPYPCVERTFLIGSPLSNSTLLSSELELTRTGCVVEDFVRSERGLAVSGVVVLVVFATAFVMKRVYRLSINARWHHRAMYEYVMLIAKWTLPRVFYNGLGPWGENNSAKIVLGYSYRWGQDFFGVLEMIFLSLATAMVAFVAAASIGFFLSGFKGLSIGAALGGGVGRLLLYMFNFVAGASDELIDYVHHELQTLQPHRLMISDSDRPHLDYLEAEVDWWVKFLIERAEDLQGDDASAVRGMAERLKASGSQAVIWMCDWLVKRKCELSYLQGTCLRLFQAEKTHFACSEYEMALLSILNLPNFLMAIACIEQLGEPPSARLFTLVGWRAEFLLKSIYIGNPRKLYYEHEADGWRSYNTRRSSELLDSSNLVEDSLEAAFTSTGNLLRSFKAFRTVMPEVIGEEPDGQPNVMPEVIGEESDGKP